ncbi:MAG: hypothetical protein SPH02_04795 [Campylobacter sp.]|nr:hypothetical protein [Campylobacter sp.]
MRLVCLRLLADRIHNSSKAAAGAIGVRATPANQCQKWRMPVK